MVNLYTLFMGMSNELPEDYKLISLVDPLTNSLVKLGLINFLDESMLYKPVSLSQDYLYLLTGTYSKYDLKRVKIKWTTPSTYKTDKPSTQIDQIGSYSFSNPSIPSFIQSKSSSFACFPLGFNRDPLLIDALTKNSQKFQLINGEYESIAQPVDFALCDDGLRFISLLSEQDYRVSNGFFNESGPTTINLASSEILPFSAGLRNISPRYLSYLRNNIPGFKGLVLESDNYLNILISYVSDNKIALLNGFDYTILSENSVGETISESKQVDFLVVFKGYDELVDNYNIINCCNVAYYDFKNQFWQKLIYSEEV